MKKSILLGALVLVSFAILVSLGNWQVQRLVWKDALIEDLEKASRSDPVAYGKWLGRQRQASGLDSNFYFEFQEFTFVTVSGKFRHDQEAYVYSVRQGKPGHTIFTPLVLSKAIRDMTIVFVNRGFVSGQLPDQHSDKIARPAGIVHIQGLTRANDIGGSFAPEPDGQKRQWFSANTRSMAKHFDYKPHEVPNLYIEADATANSGEWPKGRDPTELLSSIQNRHLGYVITWYGLALALLGVYGFFLYGNKRRSIGEQE